MSPILIAQASGPHSVAMADVLLVASDRGLLYSNGSSFEYIDRLSTPACKIFGQRFYRVIADLEPHSLDLLVYDEYGILTLRRIDQRPYNDVASRGARRCRLRVDGAADRIDLDVPGEGLQSTDCDSFWAPSPGPRATRGRARSVAHSAIKAPRVTGIGTAGPTVYVAPNWWFFDKRAHEIRVVDASAHTLARHRLTGTATAIASLGELIYISENNSPTGGVQSSCTISEFGAETLQLLRRSELHGTLTFDLAVAPSAILSGLRTGFATNSTRTKEEAQLALFARLGMEPRSLWASRQPLPPSSMRIRIDAMAPKHACVGEEFSVSYDLINLANGWLVSSPPNAVSASYRWFDFAGKQVGKDSTSLRTPLPHTLPPGETLRSRVRVMPPRRAGEFHLLLTLVQESTAWFCDASRASAYRTTVQVT